MNSEEALDQLVSHVAGCPDKQCRVCRANAEAQRVLEADAQALADVRTLDAWALLNPDDTIAPRFRGEPFAPPEQQWEGYVAGEWEFFPSADAARAASAAWVREQAHARVVETSQAACVEAFKRIEGL